MKRVLGNSAVILMVALSVPSRIYCQSLDTGGLNPLGGERNGLRVYNATISGTYYSSGLPDSLGFQPSGLNLSSDEAIGASTTIGWNRTGQRSNVSVLYSLSYSGMLQHSQWNAFNHQLGINATRKFGQKWNAAISAQAGVSTFDSFLFSPTTLSSLADVPVNFDGLSAAMLTGKFSNNQLASILTGAPVIETPAQILLYGYRSLTSALQANLAYAHSSRLTISFGAGATRNQHLSSKADVTYAGVIPQMTAATATAGLSYSLTPRTQIGASFNSSRIFSSLQRGYIYSESLSLGRRMGRRWLAQLHGGAGTLQSAQNVYASPKGVQYQAGGTLAYKTFSNTFLTSLDRTIVNSYLFGGGNSETAQGTWKWQRPGTKWILSTNMVWEKMDTLVVPPITSWRVSGGISRVINIHTAIQAQYTYTSYSGTEIPYAAAADFAQSGVRVSIMWTPQNASGLR